MAFTEAMIDRSSLRRLQCVSNGWTVSTFGPYNAAFTVPTTGGSTSELGWDGTLFFTTNSALNCPFTITFSPPEPAMTVTASDGTLYYDETVLFSWTGTFSVVAADFSGTAPTSGTVTVSNDCVGGTYTVTEGSFTTPQSIAVGDSAGGFTLPTFTSGQPICPIQSSRDISSTTGSYTDMSGSLTDATLIKPVNNAAHQEYTFYVRN